MTDPNHYRRYTCNIEAPHLKCKELRVENIIVEGSGNSYMGRTTEYASTFTLTSTELPLLANTDFVGTLDMYMLNTTTHKSGSITTGVQKIDGTLYVQMLFATTGFTTQSCRADTDTTILSDVDDEECLFSWRFTGF